MVTPRDETLDPAPGWSRGDWERFCETGQRSWPLPRPMAHEEQAAPLTCSPAPACWRQEPARTGRATCRGWGSATVEHVIGYTRSGEAVRAIGRRRQ